MQNHIVPDLKSEFVLNRFSGTIANTIETILDDKRISPDAAIQLFDLPLHDLAQLAHIRRLRIKKADYNGKGDIIVTYHIDRNINYTNICCVRCKFCAFSRDPHSSDAYVISTEQLDKKIEETIALRGKQILLQGGLNHNLSFQWHLDLIHHIKQKFPSINIHAFSPPEIVFLSKTSNLSIKNVLQKLIAAGLGSLPGGGAEILVDSVRQKLSPLKCSSNEWLQVMEIAHELGLKSSATMMFGHIESRADRITHLNKIRQLQDKTHGFVAFIPWTFQNKNTALAATKVGPTEYLRTLAVSRIFLDNIPNIQSSWITQGPDIAQLALFFGANDLGSIMIEENVVYEAGARYWISLEELVHLITEAGFIPHERNFWYDLID